MTPNPCSTKRLPNPANAPAAGTATGASVPPVAGTEAVANPLPANATTPAATHSHLVFTKKHHRSQN